MFRRTNGGGVEEAEAEREGEGEAVEEEEEEEGGGVGGGVVLRSFPLSSATSCSSGRMNAAVLPDPVGAETATSAPPSIPGIASD